MNRWICSQFGAREKYAIPRALNSRGLLSEMFTDLWIPPGSIWSTINKRAAGRFNPELANANIHHFNSSFLTRKLKDKFFAGKDDLDIQFDKVVASQLTRETKAEMFFGYSYSCGLSLRAAKKSGLTTIMGQINPGPREAEIVIEEYRRFANGVYKPFVPDDAYWDRWRSDLDFADKIIVNSEWSAQLLADEIQSSKIVVVPLAYDSIKEINKRQYPNAFDHQRPLRLLYLGGLELRKGVHYLLDAMLSMHGRPVTLDLVGGLKAPEELLHKLPANVTYHGAVAPAIVSGFYKNTDVFVFPTLSDGFGLTLLEAQAQGLPVISSLNCAQVVTDMVNGIVLKSVDSKSIADAIDMILDKPSLLSGFSSNISIADFTVNKLADRLQSLT